MSGLFTRVAALVRRNGFARSVAVLAGGTALAQAVGVIGSPLLTRLYAPADFGLLAVYTSVLSVLVVISSFRYEVAIPLPEDDGTAVRLLGVSLVSVITLSLITLCGVSLFGGHLARWLDTPGLRDYLWLLPVSLVSAGIYQAFSFWAIRKKGFGQIARTKVTQGVGQIATQIALGLLSIGPLGLLVGDVIGRASGVGALASAAWRQDRKEFNKTTLRGIGQAAYRYRRFPLFSSGSALLNTAAQQLPALLLATLYGMHVAGWYALAQRVVGLPLALLGASTAQVYLSEAAALAKETPDQLSNLMWKTVKGMFLIGLPIAVLVGMVAPWLFPLIFGQEWVEAGKYLQPLSVMFLLQFVTSPLGGTLDVLERQDLHLVREIVRVLLLASGLVLARLSNYSAMGAILALSITGALSSIVYLGASVLAVTQHGRRMASEQP